MDAAGPNADQITYWNEQTGPKWVAEQARLDRMIAPYGDAALVALAPKAGERMIDVGCGCGDTTLALAGRVGSSGSAIGVDICAPMLARARERAAESGIANARFLEADAQTHAFEPGTANAVFSRFGIMFFADPIAAFTNLRTALAPGGRVAFVCWQQLMDNPWMMVPLMAVAPIIQLPPPPAPDAPGPFSFGDRARVERILGAAGFGAIRMEPCTPDIVLGGGVDLDQATAFSVQMGPLGMLLRQAGPDAPAKVTGAVRDALAPYATPHGVVLPSAAWVVTAAR
jgi:SAM-dependent methyltransferase